MSYFHDLISLQLTMSIIYSYNVITIVIRVYRIGELLFIIITNNLQHINGFGPFPFSSIRLVKMYLFLTCYRVSLER
jgi:hypothetical protein